MLTNVPTQINRSARLVTLRHPNAMDCTVWRKKLNRTSAAAPAELGGNPTIGGLGMLDGEDEADFEYEELGDAKIVFAGIYQPVNANWNDSDSGLIYPEPPQEALIECVLEPDDPNYFVVQKPDMVTVEPGGGFVLPYEVLGETGSVHIPPYTRKFIIAARSDSQNGVG